jgi:hypothetical protein
MNLHAVEPSLIDCIGCCDRVQVYVLLDFGFGERTGRGLVFEWDIAGTDKVVAIFSDSIGIGCAAQCPELQVDELI